MKDIPTSPRIIEIKRKRRIRNMILGFLGFIFVVALVWAMSYFSSDKSMVIKDIIINGTSIINWDEVEKVVKDDLSGKYVYLFSKSNGLIYPHDKIEKDLRQNFPRMEGLKVSLNGLNTLVLDIKERKGQYLYCGETIPESYVDVGEHCYFVNNDGFIFDKAPYFSGNVYFKFYADLKDGVKPLGAQMVTPDQFHKLANFIDFVTARGFKPIYMTVNQNGINTIYLNHTTLGTIPKITWKNEDDWEIIKDNLEIAMSKKEFADEVNSKYNTLLYIDLRFKNKVLYKFQ